MAERPLKRRLVTLLDTVGSRFAVALAPVADDAVAPPATEHDGAVGDGDGDGHLVAVGDGDGAQSVCGSIGSGHAVDIRCASARGSRKRGRPRGSTKERIEIMRERDGIDGGDDQRRSRAQICRDAAEACWSRVLAKPQNVEAADAAGSSRDMVVHPMVDQRKLVVVPSYSLESEELAVACVAESQSQLVANDMGCYKENRDIAMSFTAVQSVASCAETSRLARSTITRRRLLMGAFLKIFRRTRIIASFHALYRHFKERCGNVRALHDWEKLKYDEVSMRVSVSEFADSACKSTKEKAIVKLLNCTSTHAVIFEVDGEYVTVVAKGPITIRSIEMNSAESLKASLQRQSSAPSWAREEFETCGRMIIADDHSANRKCDLSVAHDNRNWQLAAKFFCCLHKKHRIAFLHWLVFPHEASGLLHLVLSICFVWLHEIIQRQFNFLHRGPFGLRQRWRR